MKNALLLIASGKRKQSSLFVNQDVSMYASSLEASHDLLYQLHAARGAYLYLVNGRTSVNNVWLSSGDAAKITGEQKILIRAEADSEIVLFDVPLNE